MRRGCGVAATALALCACLSSASLSGGPEENPAPGPTPEAGTCNADLQNDVGNCGVCGKVCGNFANAYGLCKEAKCAIGCNTGFGDCDGKIETGCESTLATDSNHCGACGHSCGGARCVGGQCQTFAMAEVPGYVYALAADATHLYYAYNGGGTNYAIGRVPKDGSAAHADVVTGIASPPYSLTVTATDLYWVKTNDALAPNPPNGAVHREPKAGGAAAAPWLSGLRLTTPFVVADTNAFFTTYDSTPRTSTIGRAALGGMGMVDNTTAIKGTVGTLLVDGSLLYYFANGDGSPVAGRGLYRCPTSGCGTASALVSGLPANALVSQLAQDGAYLYFVSSGRTIARIKKTGDEYAPLAAMDAVSGNIRAFGVDGQRLYWLEVHYDFGGPGSTYSAWTCPIANCSDNRQEIAIRGTALALHVDDKAAFLVVQSNTGTGIATQILKVVK
jgi:hypothetical protein